MLQGRETTSAHVTPSLGHTIPTAKTPVTKKSGKADYNQSAYAPPHLEITNPRLRVKRQACNKKSKPKWEIYELTPKRKFAFAI
jgi:hypothetical protein